MTKDQRPTVGILLAAGDGIRMKSHQPKVLCQVLFKPMICWVRDACRAAGIERLYVVTGAGGQQIEQVVGPDCQYVCQSERLGTGHAVMTAREAILPDMDVAVLNGDAPFITPEALIQALAQHRAQGNKVTLLSAQVPDPTGYGRILRDPWGRVRAIVEQKDATMEQLAIREINSGAYWFDGAFLRKALEQLKPQNAQGEYYLTDTVGIAVSQGLPVGACLCEEDTVLGANSRGQLAQLNELARMRVIQRHWDNGVEIPWTDGVVIGPEVEIQAEACILPGTILKGKTVIGAGAVIGPDSVLENAVIGENAKIKASYITDSSVGAGATVGPFTQLRPGSHLAEGVKVGDFVEIKNSTIGAKTSIAHLTYLGDCDVGSQCNFGCGVVTANYDGKEKFRTVIEDRAFIGCNTNLISPVHVGEGAYTAAGTTVDGDVPAGALSIGRVRQEIKENWSDEHIAFKKKENS